MTHVLDHLMTEHREVEQLLADLKESSPGEARQTAFDELTRSLELHMRVEERFVYPLMAEHLDAETAHDATDEHDLARAGIEEARRRLEDGAFEAAIEILEAGIAHHVEEEEQELFPKLRSEAADELDDMDPDSLEADVEADDGGPEGGSGDGRSKEELYDEARSRDVPGRSSMSKGELREALEDA
jgi:hemerythrin-like domain-containing protein